MDLAGLPILTIVTFLPLVGAIAVAVLPTSAARPVALGFALLAWVVSLVLLVAYLPGNEGFEFEETVDWIPFFGVQYKLGADGLSIALVVLTTTLSWISILASFAPIQTRIKEYMIAFLVLEVGMIGVFLALDLFLFYIFWEIVLVPMYLIIGIWGGANRIYGTDRDRPALRKYARADSTAAARLATASTRTHSESHFTLFDTPRVLNAVTVNSVASADTGRGYSSRNPAKRRKRFATARLNASR
jgi:NADH:ubiquinone oxidoreductase subunit 5 (subunit L)/multisubunit Na+/H+ antiporter MnhA subunit